MTGTTYTIDLSSGERWEGVDFGVHSILRTGWLRTTHPGHRVGINLGVPHHGYIKSAGRWRRYYYETGAMGLVPCGVVNEGGAYKDLTCAVMYLQMPFMEKFFDGALFRLSERRAVYDREVHRLFIDLTRELHDPHFVGRVYAESVISALILHLFSFYPEGATKIVYPKGKLTSFQLKRVIDFCHESLGENPSLSDLAVQANLSPFHFARLFKQTIGYSPCQYLHQLKLEGAKKRIRAGKISLTEIAYELGFADQAHFCNAFRRATGVSPRRF